MKTEWITALGVTGVIMLAWLLAFAWPTAQSAAHAAALTGQALGWVLLCALALGALAYPLRRNASEAFLIGVALTLFSGLALLPMMLLAR